VKLTRTTKAIVTGAASGIGRATALALAAKGVALWLTDIDAPGLQRTAEQASALGVQVEATVCDLLQPGAVDDLAAQILRHWPDPTLLVNSAGITAYGRTHELDEKTWDRVLGLNLHVPIRLTNALLPALTVQRQAHVVNLCSIFGLTAMPYIAPYQTSKFGLVGYSLALDAEYGRRGFGVTAVCPGIVRTPLIAGLKAASGLKIPATIGLTPEFVARRIVRAVERNAGLIVLAPSAYLSWRLMRISPGLMRWFHRSGLVARFFPQRLPPPAR
jgi:short-subunit dehydrogenase